MVSYRILEDPGSYRPLHMYGAAGCVARVSSSRGTVSPWFKSVARELLWARVVAAAAGGCAATAALRRIWPGSSELRHLRALSSSSVSLC